MCFLQRIQQYKIIGLADFSPCRAYSSMGSLGKRVWRTFTWPIRAVLCMLDSINATVTTASCTVTSSLNISLAWAWDSLNKPVTSHKTEDKLWYSMWAMEWRNQRKYGRVTLENFKDDIDTIKILKNNHTRLADNDNHSKNRKNNFDGRKNISRLEQNKRYQKWSRTFSFVSVGIKFVTIGQAGGGWTAF